MEKFLNQLLILWIIIGFEYRIVAYQKGNCTATEETVNTQPTNSNESENIDFMTATSQPDSTDVDSLVNSLDVKQQLVLILQQIGLEKI